MPLWSPYPRALDVVPALPATRVAEVMDQARRSLRHAQSLFTLAISEPFEVHQYRALVCSYMTLVIEFKLLQLSTINAHSSLLPTCFRIQSLTARRHQ